MKKRFENCLEQAKPLLRELIDQLSGRYSYASVLGMDAECRQYSVSNSGINIMQNDSFTKCGYVVKVYDGSSYAEYSFSTITKDEIAHILKVIDESLVPMAKKLPAGVHISEYGCLEDEKVTLSKSTECKVWPEDLGDGEIIDRLVQIHEAGLAYDPKILDCSVSVSYQKCSKLFLSKNKDLFQNVMWTNGYVIAVAKKGQEVKNAFTPCSVLGGMEVLDQMEGQVALTAQTVIELLDSKPMVPGEYDCVCTPDVTGVLVHEAFGHGVEMDMFVKDRALAKQYVGEYVASPLVTMHDTASAVNESGTYFFDDEGIIAQDTVIIEKGILKRGISDAQTAMHLGTKPTGNARRESFERKAYTRMTNTYFEGGNDKPEDMIASIRYGFLIENILGGMEDPKNWGIMVEATVAREIKDGVLTGNIFSPVTMTGYVPDLLKSISMVSKEVELSGCGYCGKGHKEWVKVSSGGPYIKAKIRLG